MQIRRAQPGDVEQLIEMMRALAEFEGYAPNFRVTEKDLHARAFGPGAQCTVLVADLGGRLAGYAVYHVQHFTYDLRRNVILKELFVDASQRGAGVAGALLDRLKEEATGLGAGRIQWLVLPANARAKRLYRRFGGQPDTSWERWQLDLC